MRHDIYYLKDLIARLNEMTDRNYTLTHEASLLCLNDETTEKRNLLLGNTKKEISFFLRGMLEVVPYMIEKKLKIDLLQQHLYLIDSPRLPGKSKREMEVLHEYFN
jgi:hypothetical protein